jgi:RPA family protein
MKYITILLIIFLLTGCLGREGPETVTIQEVLVNPNAYMDEEVVIKGVTVEDMIGLQQGMVLVRMVDSTGARLSGVYTGDLYTVNTGDAATFLGTIKTQEAFGGAHLGTPVVMEITSIKDVVLGGGTAVAPGTPSPVISQNPTIGQIIANAALFENQVIEIEGTVTDVKQIEQHAETPLTYIQVDDGTGRIWVSMPQTQVEIGNEVTLTGSVLLNFGPYDMVILSEGVSSVSGSPHGAPAPSTTTITVKPGEVEKVENGYTVEELFSSRASLDGQTVKVRGKVVKVVGELTVGGVPRVWFHIQDGTGSPAHKTDDLIVTYSGDPPIAPGDIVVATGVLGADKDIGAGYFFDAILEDATVEK